MKYIFTLIASCLLLTAHAQRNCATMDVFSAAAQANPQVLQQRAIIEQQTHDWLQQHPQNGERNIITIPVVVHVVYKTAGENISDVQVQSQIDILNEDYSRTNADAAQTPTMFQGVAANCEIQFCLAQQDPNGLPTNGITRTQTTANSFPIGAAVKHASTGGKDAWPSDSYLNIWVCNIVSPVIGFATLPGTAPADEDGVVIVYKHFGRIGNVEAPYNKGRTATHEIGHWLNMLHIWGDDENSADPCLGTDQVSDTPNQSGPNFGCPTSGTASCSNGGDMFMNYMDYTDDNCMNMFTTGQKNRMIATLNGVRSSIPGSQGCQVPSIEQTCDTLNNIIGGDGLVYYMSYEVVPEDAGYLTGTNSRGDLAYAEKHTVSAPYTVEAIRFDFAYAYDGTGTSNLRVAIWEDDGTSPAGSPGTLVAEASVSYADIANNVDNFTFTDVQFPTSPLVDGDFYVGFYTSEIATDTIAIYSNQIDKINVNTAWLQDFEDNWFTFDATETYSSALSLAIRPIVCSTVGVEEVLSSELLVYPNPSNGMVNVVFPAHFSASTWQIYSIDGRSVKKGTTTSDRLSLDFSDAENGVYILQTSDGKSVSSSRFSIIR